MNTDIILLHLSLIEGIGPITIKKIVEQINRGFDLPDIYTLQNNDFTSLFGFSSAVSIKLCSGLQDTRTLEQEVKLLEKHRINFISVIHEKYPKLLGHIYAPPPILYWKGSDILNASKKIAFVGARKANQYGQMAIDTMIPELVKQDWVIVSGGALGADTMAHQATLAAKGKTIVVLGSGLLKPYPFSNRRLFDEIMYSGSMIISSFPLLTEARPGNFPSRNRIIAGLSVGCVVIQAAEKSGACITAQCALHEGREVFAVPGAIDDILSVGCHMLIQQGAKLVAQVSDICSEFSQYNQKAEIKECDPNMNFIKTDLTLPAKRDDIKQDDHDDSIESLILKCCKSPCSIDDIAISVQMDFVQLHEVLFEMQLSGKIQQNFAGMWEGV